MLKNSKYAYKQLGQLNKILGVGTDEVGAYSLRTLGLQESNGQTLISLDLIYNAGGGVRPVEFYTSMLKAGRAIEQMVNIVVSLGDSGRLVRPVTSVKAA